MSSPSKVKKLRRHHVRLWGHKHRNRNTKQGLMFSTDKYEITSNKTLSAVEKVKLIKSFGHLSYVSANYKQNKIVTSSLVLLDGKTNKFYCTRKMNYASKGYNYKLEIDSEPTLMDSQYIIDGIPTEFRPSAIDSIRKQIQNHVKQFNDNKAQKAMQKHENESEDDLYQVPLLPENNTRDESSYSLEEKADEVLAWKNDLNQIKQIDPTIDWIHTQIQIFEKNGKEKKKLFHEIDDIIRKRLTDQKKQNQKIKLSYKYPKNNRKNTTKVIDKNQQNSEVDNNAKPTVGKKKTGKDWPCVCGCLFGSLKALCAHHSYKREFGDLLHLQSTHYCSFWDSGNCAPIYHHFPTKESKNHHELFTHHNEVKKNNIVPNFEKKCCKCGKVITEWKVSRNGNLKGIRCSHCKHSYWVKIKYKKEKNKLNDVEKSIIQSQFKTMEEMQQEYAGVRGEKPPTYNSNGTSAVSTESPSRALSSLSLVSNGNSNNKQCHGNSGSNKKLNCQVCKLLIGINSYFDSEQDLKAHLAALHKK